MRYGSRHAAQPVWPPVGWPEPQRSLAQRAGRAAAHGAGRLAVAGGKRAYARRRPLAPLTVAAAVHLAALAMRLPAHRYVGTVDLILAVGLLPLAWRARRWPVWRRAYMACAALAVLAYLPIAVLWTPGLPVLYVSAGVSVALWLWLYFGYYRIRRGEPEPMPSDDGPAEVWAEFVGCQGGAAPGSVLVDVREIEAPE